MGDRSNVFIQTARNDDGTWRGVGIYAHWGGERLHEAALEALPLALRRKGDESYFTRIMVQNVLNAVARPDEETGAGIWTDFPDDNEHPYLVINAVTGHHWFCRDGRSWSDPELVGPVEAIAVREGG